jgi:hypothetical protein
MTPTPKMHSTKRPSRSYTFLVDDTLERHVQTQAFDEQRAAYSKRIIKGSLSDDTDSEDSSDHTIEGLSL